MGFTTLDSTKNLWTWWESLTDTVDFVVQILNCSTKTNLGQKRDIRLYQFTYRE